MKHVAIVFGFIPKNNKENTETIKEGIEAINENNAKKAEEKQQVKSIMYRLSDGLEAREYARTTEDNLILMDKDGKNIFVLDELYVDQFGEEWSSNIDECIDARLANLLDEASTKTIKSIRISNMFAYRQNGEITDKSVYTLNENAKLLFLRDNLTNSSGFVPQKGKPAYYIVYEEDVESFGIVESENIYVPGVVYFKNEDDAATVITALCSQEAQRMIGV